MEGENVGVGCSIYYILHILEMSGNNSLSTVKDLGYMITVNIFHGCKLYYILHLIFSGMFSYMIYVTKMCAELITKLGKKNFMF